MVLFALSRLPAPQRQALVLAYWGGLTAEEIARQSGVPLGTVKSRIRLGPAGAAQPLRATARGRRAAGRLVTSP